MIRSSDRSLARVSAVKKEARLLLNLKSNTKRGLALVALLAVPLAVNAVPAAARVDVGIDVGIPAIAAPPVVVAPPAVYAPPPAVVVSPPAVYAGPVVVGGGYWWYDRWGHRYWRRR
jgi:hypothetical protein